MHRATAPCRLSVILLVMACPLSLAQASGVDSLTLRWAVTFDAARLANVRAPIGLPVSAWPELLVAASERAAANRAADAGAAAARGLSQQAWASAWMPRIDANASASKSHQRVNDTTVRTPTTALSLTATLPLWRAADRATARAQSAQADEAAWQARSTRATIARELSVAYLGAVEAAEQRRLQQAQQNLLAEQLRINERRLQAGVGTVLDVLETRTRIEQTRAAVQDLDTRLASQRLTLLRLSGLPVVLPAGFDERASALLPHVVPPPHEAFQLAEARNPDLQGAQALAQAARAVTQARSAERWQPTLDAVASASRVREVPQLDGFSQQQRSTEQAVGVQMNWPLFTGGLHQGRVREAAALLAQAQAREDETRAQVDTSLTDAYQSLSQARAAIRVQSEVERTAAATHEAVRKAFVAGMRTNLDLLNAQQQIYAARQSLVAARANALLAQVSILALLDLLDPDHVAGLLTVFDTTALPQTTDPAP